MKELSVEEKAKAYDNVVGKLKQFMAQGVDPLITRADVQDFFPELKESEDERIREHLIKHFGNKSKEDWNGVPVKSILAWLEKQGEKGTNGNDREIPISEQKPVEVRTTGYWNVQDTEQKTTDNVKPKFHEGDWIIHQGTENIYQVVAVIDNQYQLKYGDNYTTQYCIDVDRCTRLYDVTKDVKDGDVLVNQNGEMPFIFKECKNNHIYCYCGYTNRKDIFFDGFVDSEGEELHWLNLYYEQAYPATNEQRDLLFKKMHEAGYEWNAEHKQLKKIEQSPVWSKEDDAGFADVMWAIQKARTIAKNENDMGNLWCAERFLKSLKERYTWKPSDEMLEALYRVIPESVMEKSEDEVLLDKLYQGLKYGKVLSEK